MTRKWTEDQQKVIETTDRNLLVSAAAGSGKTAVLVERILQMVTDSKNPVDIDRFIIMTFTRAAAAQMRQKIGVELEKRQLLEPDNVQLRRQLRLLNNACISTIDSFCIGIVRDYFHVLDLDPSFRVADDTELALIRGDCMDEVMGRWYEKKDTAPEEYTIFNKLLEGYCSHKGDSALTSTVFSLADKALSHPWPVEWLESIRRDYSMKTIEEFDASMIAVATVSHVHSMLQGAAEKLERGLEMCGREDGPDYFITALTSDLELVKKISDTEKYSELSSLLSGYSFPRLSSSKKGNPELRAKVSDIRGSVKDQISDIISKFFYYNADRILETIVNSKEPVDGLVSLTEDYLECFDKAKREKNVIDFSDAEHFALEILLKKDENGKRVRSDAALELQKQYHEIIIDEYQDSNEIQECIANAIAGEPSERPFIFTVGDVKQSIYKFRNACPEIFVGKQKLYERNGGYGRLIGLDRNFRSREEVLEGTNAIFYQIMHENLGGIEYDTKCSLKCGTDAQRLTAHEAVSGTDEIYNDDTPDSVNSDLWEKTPYKTELILINKEGSSDEAFPSGAAEDNGDTDGEGLAAENAREREARAAAHRIRHLIYEEKLQVKTEVNGKEIVRNAEYGDIVILLRTMKGWADVFCRIFEEEGIPAISDVSDGFFKSSEIMLVLDLLSIIDNPRRDIPLTAVLTSVIGGFNVNDLADIKIAGKSAKLTGTVSFYDELCVCAACDNVNMEGVNAESGISGSSTCTSSEKARRFLALYESLRNLKNEMGIAELIGEIYKRTDIYSYYSAMPDGEKRSGNLDLLLGYAADYENTGFSGLFSFIRYLDKLKGSDQDYGDAGNSRAGNCVRIMSIHKSKGLEFPIVILAGIGKAFNKQDMRGDIIVSSSHGLGIKYVDTEKRIKYNSFHHSVINTKYTEDMVGEEMRLLYVAMTRAKEKLIMMGTQKKLPAELSYHSLFTSSNYVDFLYMPAKNREQYIRTLIISPDEAGAYSWTKKCFGDCSDGNQAAEPEKTESCGEEKKAAEPEKTESCGEEKKAAEPEKTESCGEEKKAAEPEKTESYYGEKQNSQQELLQELLRIRELEYPYRDEAVLPVKLSVSDLKLEAIEETGDSGLLFENEIYDPDKKTVPGFIAESRMMEDITVSSEMCSTGKAEQDTQIRSEENSADSTLQQSGTDPGAQYGTLQQSGTGSGTQYGTLMHKVMQFIPMEYRTTSQVRDFLKLMLERRMLSEAEYHRLRVDSFVRFLNTELAERIRKAAAAGNLMREKQFMMGMRACDISSEKYGDSQELIPIQGVIDAMFEEAGELVILDYKTDRVADGETDILISRYRLQLELYARAAEQLTGMKVKEMYLYSFALGESVKIV